MKKYILEKKRSKIPHHYQLEHLQNDCSQEPKDKGSEVDMKITKGLALPPADGCDRGWMLVCCASREPLACVFFKLFINIMIPWNHDIFRLSYHAVDSSNSNTRQFIALNLKYLYTFYRISTCLFIFLLLFVLSRGAWLLSG